MLQQCRFTTARLNLLHTLPSPAMISICRVQSYKQIVTNVRKTRPIKANNTFNAMLHLLPNVREEVMCLCHWFQVKKNGSYFQEWKNLHLQFLFLFFGRRERSDLSAFGRLSCNSCWLWVLSSAMFMFNPLLNTIFKTTKGFRLMQTKQNEATVK